MDTNLNQNWSGQVPQPNQYFHQNYNLKYYINYGADKYCTRINTPVKITISNQA